MENMLFRQTFRGFDRRQVLEYIDNLSAEMSKQAEEYSEMQKGLENEIHTLSLQLSESKDNLGISRAALEKLQEDLKYLEQNNGELKKRVTSYRNMILVRDRQISEIKTDYRKLAEHSRQLEKENADWKARQEEIAVCMVEANLRAKQIIADANAQAEKTKAEFDANAANLMEKVGDVRSEIGRLETELEASFSKLANVIASMDKASRTIETQVKEYYDKVDKLDRPAPLAEIAEEKPRPKPEQIRRPVPNAKVAVKKPTLTDSVLDTISRLLEK